MGLGATELNNQKEALHGEQRRVWGTDDPVIGKQGPRAM